MDSTSKKSTMPVGPHHDLLTEKVAIDCEMMRSSIGQVLGRVSVINDELETIYDTFVCYPGTVIITNTDEAYSGINFKDLEPRNGAQLFSEVQSQLKELLRDRTVIGHDIEKDLTAMSMDLQWHIQGPQLGYICPTPAIFSDKLRDTQKYSGYRQYASKGAHQGPNLKNLAIQILGRRIKQGRTSSVEDAVATMEIYRNAEGEIDREQGK